MRIKRKLSPEKQILVQKAIEKMMPEEQDQFDTVGAVATNLFYWYFFNGFLK